MHYSKKHHLELKDIVIVAILIAIQVVLARFLSISLWNLKIGFSFVPIFIAARKLGTFEAVLVAGLGDFIGAILFPIGPYFPGFTVTAILMALCNGLLFHKHCDLKRIVFSVVINQLLGSLLLNTLWISILYSKAYTILLVTRVFQTIVMTFFQIAVGYLLLVKQSRFLDRLVPQHRMN